MTAAWHCRVVTAPPGNSCRHRLLAEFLIWAKSVMEWDFAGSLSPELELGSVLTHWLMRPEVNQRGLLAFRDGYGEVREWPKLGLDSFAVAITGWLNWTYNAICEAIDADDADHAVFAEREAVGVLDRPMTRGGLGQLLVV